MEKIGEVTHGSIVNLSKCKLNWCLIKKINLKVGYLKNIYGELKNMKLLI